MTLFPCVLRSCTLTLLLGSSPLPYNSLPPCVALPLPNRCILCRRLGPPTSALEVLSTPPRHGLFCAAQTSDSRTSECELFRRCSVPSILRRLLFPRQVKLIKTSLLVTSLLNALITFRRCPGFSCFILCELLVPRCSTKQIAFPTLCSKVIAFSFNSSDGLSSPGGSVRDVCPPELLLSQGQFSKTTR